MRYCMSDIHGAKEIFFRMLREIAFDPSKDHLYLLGDMIDRGSDIFELFHWIREHGTSVTLIRGNHEYYLMRYLQGKEEPGCWKEHGGHPELIDPLAPEEKKALLSWLCGLPLYVVPEKTFFGETVLCHAGGLLKGMLRTAADGKIDVLSSMKAAAEESEARFLKAADILELKEADLTGFVIFGHYPVYHLLPEEAAPVAYRGKDFLCIDIGITCRKGRLGCLCLDTGEMIYLEKEAAEAAGPGGCGCHL